jgi:hypothetical protein
MKRILLALPVIFSILAMSPVMAALKPYCQETITTSAFDFSINSIDALNDICKIRYLEYGRADAMVTKIDLNPGQSSDDWTTYNGKLYFYASGLDWHFVPFKITVIADGKLHCTEFSTTKLDCTANKGTMIVTSKTKGARITIKDFELVADKTADTLTVSAYDRFGNKVLDAAVEDWGHRVPQKPIVFNEVNNNFARFPNWCTPLQPFDVE